MYPNLKFQLWRSGIRQNRLAQMLEMDETTLSRIVNGYRTPSDQLKGAIATLLRCEAEWLFQRNEDIVDPAPGMAKPVSQGSS